MKESIKTTIEKFDNALNPDLNWSEKSNSLIEGTIAANKDIPGYLEFLRQEDIKFSDISYLQKEKLKGSIKISHLEQPKSKLSKNLKKNPKLKRKKSFELNLKRNGFKMFKNSFIQMRLLTMNKFKRLNKN